MNGGSTPTGTARRLRLQDLAVPAESIPSMEINFVTPKRLGQNPPLTKNSRWHFTKVKCRRLDFFGIKKGHFLIKFKYLTPKILIKGSALMFKDYNMNQLVLPLDLEIKLQNTTERYRFSHSSTRGKHSSRSFRTVYST